MKSIIKTSILLIILILAIFTYMPNKVYGLSSLDNMVHSADDFIQEGANGNVIDKDKLHETSNYIYNILFTIAVVLAVAVGMVIGIQFITGSVDEKAKIKETLIPYIVGVFVIFSAFTIWKIAVNIGNKTTSTITDRGGQCPYCGTALTSGQILDLERNGSTTCRNSRCNRTINN